MNKIMEIIKNKMVFIKYLFSSGISFVLDLTLFTIFKFILKNNFGAYILFATIIARVISSFINYLLNRNAVFKSDKKGSTDKESLIKYYALVIIQMFVSGTLVTILHDNINIDETIIKIPVEVVLFVINFFVQKVFIFNNNKINITIPNNIKCLMLTLLTICSLFLELDKKNIFKFNSDDMAITLLFVGVLIYGFYVKFINNYKSNWQFKLLSILFSILMVIGYSYDKLGNAYFVFGNISFVIYSIIKIMTLSYLFNICLNIIYDKLNTYEIKDIIKKNKFIELFNNHPFIVSFVIMLICFIPYMIAFYPAIMGYDPSNQIREFMGMHTRYMDSVILLDENVTITNFNPVLHTLLLGGCFKLGHIIGNDNLGLFFYSVISVLIVLTTLSYSISYMKKNGVNNKLLFIVLAIYCLVPIYPFYSITTNKDMIFCCFILLYILKLHDLITNEQSIKKYIIFTIIMVFTCLTRNNGIYTILLSLPFALIWLKDKRKGIIISLICVLLCYGTYNKVILPAFKISNTSIREMLSIPFQQTARYVKYHPEEFTNEDKEVINKVFDYKSYADIYDPTLKEKYSSSFDTFGDLYDPELSDPIKNQYNIYNTNEDLVKYFGVWSKGLVKRPVVYIDATINNVYGYFYPNTSDWTIYYKYNTRLKEAGFDYHYNNQKGLRKVLSEYGRNFVRYPIIGSLINMGLAAWIYMFLFMALWVKKQYKYIPFVLPAISFLLVCIAGPANTYFRYAWPYLMSMPVVLCLLYLVFNKKNVISK